MNIFPFWDFHRLGTPLSGYVLETTHPRLFKIEQPVSKLLVVRVVYVLRLIFYLTTWRLHIRKCSVLPPPGQIIFQYFLPRDLKIFQIILIGTKNFDPLILTDYWRI